MKLDRTLKPLNQWECFKIWEQKTKNSLNCSSKTAWNCLLNWFRLISKKAFLRIPIKSDTRVPCRRWEICCFSKQKKSTKTITTPNSRICLQCNVLFHRGKENIKNKSGKVDMWLEVSSDHFLSYNHAWLTCFDRLVIYSCSKQRPHTLFSKNIISQSFLLFSKHFDVHVSTFFTSTQSYELLRNRQQIKLKNQLWRTESESSKKKIQQKLLFGPEMCHERCERIIKSCCIVSSSSLICFLIEIKRTVTRNGKTMTSER